MKLEICWDGRDARKLTTVLWVVLKAEACDISRMWPQQYSRLVQQKFRDFDDFDEAV